MKKLYEVIIKMYVAADNEDDARYEAHARDGADIRVYRLHTVNQLLADWAGSIPFGADDDRTCREYFERKSNGR
jgi:hypothetical protein